MSRKRDIKRAIRRKKVFKYGINWLLGQRLRELGKAILRGIRQGIKDSENRKNVNYEKK